MKVTIVVDVEPRACGWCRAEGEPVIYEVARRDPDNRPARDGRWCAIASGLPAGWEWVEPRGAPVLLCAVCAERKERIVGLLSEVRR